MAFEGLSEKLIRRIQKAAAERASLTEADVREAAMREVRLALLEADVNYKVAKEFVDAVTERAVGAAVLREPDPGPAWSSRSSTKS